MIGPSDSKRYKRQPLKPRLGTSVNCLAANLTGHGLRAPAVLISERRSGVRVSSGQLTHRNCKRFMGPALGSLADPLSRLMQLFRRR